jgi:alpha-beta hydrolase superfamily lysophospholipase
MHIPAHEVEHRRDVLDTADGHQIHVQSWLPSQDLAAVIQVLHGLGEHADRYARFAAMASRRGYALYVHDHRGHGRRTPHAGHLSDHAGWQYLVDDAHRVTQLICERHSHRNIVLLGHSMGSYVAQSYAMRHGDECCGLILSASTWPSRAQLLPARVLARIETWRLGRRGNSALLDQLGFGNFNRKFEPARSAFDWLSRDTQEVDQYISDPLCGGPYSCGLWQDVLDGLWQISSDSAIKSIPATLPILITGGSEDPVGGEKGMSKLAARYARCGHQHLKLKLYAGGRHEMLNEINRDDVSRDWLDWIDATTGSER